MNLLFLTPQFPWPLDNGGKIGAFQGMRVVSGFYQTTILSFTEEPQRIAEGLHYFSKAMPEVHFEMPVTHDVHIRKKPFKLARAMAKSYLCTLPYLTAKFDTPKMYREIDRMFANSTVWDVVFIDYLNMEPYGNYIRKKYPGQYQTVILKDHNVEYELVRQTAASAHGLKKAVLESEWRRTKRYEQQAVSKADTVFSVCPENTERLKQWNPRSYTMLPNFEMLPARKAALGEHNILFFGNLSWEANLDGLRWFVKRVFPRILAQIPDAVLTVAGSGVGNNPFADCPSVRFAGYVEDISAIYERQNVFIVPLFEGSGIRIKILDAFNHEIAVVSTAVGCGTISAKNGEQLFVADTEEDFARQVLRLLSDGEENNRMRHAAKQFLSAYYSLESGRDMFRKAMGYPEGMKT